MWVDRGLYWGWYETAQQAKARLEARIPMPPVPTKKELEYVTLYKGTPLEMKLCVGVWDDENFRTVNEAELGFHLLQGG